MKGFRKLSQVLGALGKGYAVDSFMGGFPVTQIMMDVATASGNGVLASTTLASGVETTVTSGITSPAAYRNLTIKGGQSGQVGSVTILGKDWADRTITESIALSGSSTVQGVLPFKHIDKIIFPARHASGDTVIVGWGNKLGLYRPIEASGDIVLLKVAGTGESAAAVSAAYGTITPTTVPNGTRDYEISYLTKQF